MSIAALYLHVPFCRARCAYCDFETRAYPACDLEGAISAYLDRLERRIEHFGRQGALEGVETVYIGGGTPSLLGGRLVDLAARVLSYCAPVEFTCEANPESFDAALAYGLAGAGVTRISLGVQSLQPGELRAIGRIHSREQALCAARSARNAGLAVSCDLMCGLPGQTVDTFRSSLWDLLAAGPDHVSVYPLQLEEGTALYRRVEDGSVAVPDEDCQADCMEAARSILMSHGYEPYEVASYARPGHACRHNIAYWTGKSYLGIGRAAAGMLDAGEARDYLCIDVPQEAARVRYVQADDDGGLRDIEFMTAREAAAEDLMLAFRMTCGASEDLLRASVPAIPASLLEEACRRACDLGLARWLPDGGRLVPTELGWLEGNELFELFWDLAE